MVQVGFLVASVFSIFVLRKLAIWRHHIQTARKSGFVVHKSPVHTSDLWWLALYPKLVPLLNKLPLSWRKGWLPLSRVFNLWHVGYEPFLELGSDNIMLSSPNGNMLWTSDPEIINQITAQGAKFTKPVELFSFFDTYGPNMQTSEGADWKSHRKIIAPAIGPHSNATMWRAALHESKRLSDLMIKDNLVITHMKDHMSEISLHCITKCFFDTELEYETTGEYPTPTLPSGRFGFVEAMFTTIDKLGIIDSIPRGLRGLIPFESIRRADKAYRDLHSHIVAICDKAEDMEKDISQNVEMSVMDALMAGTKPESAEKNGKILSREALIGNVFFFLLSGHGTAGSTLGFVMLLLAVRKDVQAEMQAHIDSELGDKLAATWTVTGEFMKLYNGYTGSVLKEAMRLYNAVEFIPRRCLIDTNVTDMSGNQLTVPRDTLCLLNFTAAFRHPKIWPTGANCKDSTGRYHPLLDFDPKRWESYSDKITKPSDVGLRTYFPFGLGGRSCLGKSLGSIMMIGIMASIFKDYSVELVVPRAIEEEAAKSGASEEWVKDRTYDWALKMLVDEVECNLLIELRKEFPVRLVPRR